MQLPDELIDVLAMLGLTWPEADEELLFERAGHWLEFSSGAGDQRDLADEAVMTMLAENTSPGLERFDDYWDRIAAQQLRLGRKGDHLLMSTITPEDLHSALDRHQAWWQRSGDGDQLDLSDHDLRGFDLTGLDLSGVLFNGADLSGARLAGAVLARCELLGATLARADLSDTQCFKIEADGADFTGADLRRADLHRADLSTATLVGADVSGARIRYALLVGTDCSQALLAGALFEAAGLDRTVLDGADASGASGTVTPGSTVLLADTEQPAVSGLNSRGAQVTVFQPPPPEPPGDASTTT